MRTKSEILNDLNDSTKKLLAGIEKFPEGRFNDKPNGDAWSAGQVGEHLIKVETGTVRLFTGSTEPADRDPEEKIERIEEEFLNFEKKFTAFGPILPDEKPKDQQKVVNKLQDIRQRLASLVDLHDLSALCTGFEHGLFGYLTRVEWIYFTIIHSRRHLEQVRRIKRDID